MVYDGLLEDKQAKLIEDLVQQKQSYDATCNMLVQKDKVKVTRLNGSAILQCNLVFVF